MNFKQLTKLSKEGCVIASNLNSASNCSECIFNKTCESLVDDLYELNSSIKKLAKEKIKRIIINEK